MITVGNKRHGDKGIYVGRPSPLGNPYVLSGNNRARIIQEYEEWLQLKLNNSENVVYEEFHKIVDLAKDGDITLVCWCSPLQCHADVIKKYIEKAIGEIQ